PLPDAIDDHSHRDRLAQNGFGQLEATAATGKAGRRAVAEHRKEMTWLFVSRIERIAAFADVEVDRLLDVGDAVDEREPRRLRLPERFDILPQRVDVAPPVGGQLPL